MQPHVPLEDRIMGRKPKEDPKIAQQRQEQEKREREEREEQERQKQRQLEEAQQRQLEQQRHEQQRLEKERQQQKQQQLSHSEDEMPVEEKVCIYSIILLMCTENLWLEYKMIKCYFLFT